MMRTRQSKEKLREEKWLRVDITATNAELYIDAVKNLQTISVHDFVPMNHGSEAAIVSAVHSIHANAYDAAWDNLFHEIIECDRIGDFELFERVYARFEKFTGAYGSPWINANCRGRNKSAWKELIEKYPEFFKDRDVRFLS